MIRLIVGSSLAALALASPSWADECPYVSGFDFGRVTFSADGTEATFDFNGDIVKCALEYGDENGNWLTCEDGSEGQFSFAQSALGIGDDTIFIYRNSAWYRQCPDLTPLELGTGN